MFNLKIITHSIILATSPSLLVFPERQLAHAGFHVHPVHSKKLGRNFREKERYCLATYDEILTLLDEIESGKAEEKYREKDLVRIDNFLAYLAHQGMLSNCENPLALQADIEDLLFSANSENQFAFALEDNFSIIPAIFSGRTDLVLCKSWASKNWKKTRKFVKNHKKEIVIGAVIVVAVAAIVVIVVACPPAAPAAQAIGAAGVASGSLSNKSQPSKKALVQDDPPHFLRDVLVEDAPIFQATLEDKIFSFKEELAGELFFQTPTANAPYEGISWEETGRVLGSLFTAESLKDFQSEYQNYPQLAQEIHKIRLDNNLPTETAAFKADFTHQEIDRVFSTDYATLFDAPSKVVDFKAAAYHIRGEKALSYGYYEQAVSDLGKAIELDPASPLAYLERGTAYFHLGEYDLSLEDFNQFTSQAPETQSFDFSEFGLGLAKGLPKGILESGEGILLFLSDLITHPFRTGEIMGEALTLLSKLALTEEWEVLGQAVVPEIHHLVTNWNTLPSHERGELSGYALGKYGADFLVPGTIAKITSKGTKGAKQLNTVYRNLKSAERTLVLEAVSALENSGKIRGIIQAKAVVYAEEIGSGIREVASFQKNDIVNSAFNKKGVFHRNLLKTHLRQVEEYGASGYHQLSNGRMRYYGELEAARTKGEMVGRRLVREWDPATGLKRTWHETIDHNGNVRIVRPETNNMNKIHYIFDREGNFIEAR